MGRDIFDKAFTYKGAQEVRSMGLYPYFVEIESSTGTEIVIQGKPRINLGSNNYLGLTHHPEVIAAAQEVLPRYGTGCTGSRFLNGTLDLHVRAEQELARFVGKPAALVFSTGYQTNLGVIATLAGMNDVVIIDKLNHACIVDGARLAFGHTLRFQHNDMEDLERQLVKAHDKGKLVVVDGVFSMEGDIAHLPDIVRLCKKYGARLMVDDAHAFGVLGETGAGTAEQFGLTDHVDLIMATFSKSLASIGGFVAGEPEVIDFLKHKARALIFSASTPPAAIATALKALEIIRREPERRKKLWENSRFLLENLRSMGYNLGKTETPVLPIIIGDNLLTFRVWRELFDAGVYVNPVIAPAVPEGTARLRISCIATHTREQLARAVEIFHTVGRRLGLLK